MLKTKGNVQRVVLEQLEGCRGRDPRWWTRLSALGLRLNAAVFLEDFVNAYEGNYQDVTFTKNINNIDWTNEKVLKAAVRLLNVDRVLPKCILTSLSNKVIQDEAISKYLLSVDVMAGKENLVFAKIVCVRNKANRKEWLAFICTDMELSEEEVIRICGKRWQIEVFLKACKSLLNLVGECRSLSNDALTAHVAIVFARYMLLSAEQRQNEEQRTFRSIRILWDALLASL